MPLSKRVLIMQKNPEMQTFWNVQTENDSVSEGWYRPTGWFIERALGKHKKDSRKE